MTASRRTFLRGLLAATTIPTLSWADAGAPAFLAAARDADGSDALYGLGASGEDRFRIPLPARAHAGAAHPSRPEAVVIARRPGTFALVLDCVTGTVLATLTSPKGRHFMGHGAFSADGQLFYTVENAFDDRGTGRVGIWNRAADWQRIGEFATHGIGPHEVLLMPGGQTLAVANGGIRTHPDTGRDMLNLDSMRPGLAYFTTDGALQDQVFLPDELHQNSLRHLAVRADGLVAFALQWQGDPAEIVPLLGLHQPGTAPVLASAEPGEQATMKGYAGSVAFDAAGDRVAISSPGGGRVHLFDGAGGFVAALPRADVCGLAVAPGGILVSDGLGGIQRIEADLLRPLRTCTRAWDNHVVSLHHTSA